MTPFSRLGACLALAICAATSFAQKDNSSAAPVAFVYVARPTHIDAFAASASGVLTAVPGSPYAGIAATNLNVNKNFLFALTSGDDIYSYSIAANGSIKEASVTKVSSGCGGSGPTEIDASGTTLYWPAPIFRIQIILS